MSSKVVPLPIHSPAMSFACMRLFPHSAGATFLRGQSIGAVFHHDMRVVSAGQFEITALHFGKFETKVQMRYSLSSLRVFVVVAEVGSITEAAERLGKTPSTISAALKLFEEEIGVPLFETERKNRLSKAGLFVRAQAQDVLLHYDRAISAIQAFGRNQSGRVDLACVPSVATAILPAVVLEFRKRFAGVEIDVRDMDSPSVVEAVASGKVEFGLASLKRPRSDLSVRSLFEEGLGIVCRPDDPLVELGRSIAWEDLKGRTILGNGITNLIADPAFSSLTENAPIVVYNVLSLLALVRAGAGITVLPRLSVAGITKDVTFLPAADPAARRVVGLIARAGERLSPAAQAFVDRVEAVISRSELG